MSKGIEHCHWIMFTYCKVNVKTFMKNKGSSETETTISKQENIFQSKYSVLVTELLSIQTEVN